MTKKKGGHHIKLFMDLSPSFISHEAWSSEYAGMFRGVLPSEIERRGREGRPLDEGEWTKASGRHTEIGGR